MTLFKVPAYQKIEFGGSTRRIVPKLVTGLKCWHLRPESTFYPKFNFFNVVRTIPKNANVIFQFGEIDCREGIVFAVQKMIYEVLSLFLICFHYHSIQALSLCLFQLIYNITFRALKRAVWWRSITTSTSSSLSKRSSAGPSSSTLPHL